MSTVLLGGFENQNSNRRYPFTDDATVTDTNDVELPTDYIVDAALYPLDVVGPIYLSRLDNANSLGYFRDAASGAVCGYFALDGSDTAAAVFEPEFDRQVGVVVFGDGRASGAAGGATRDFIQAATQLVPSAAIPLNQAGVRGFLLPDGEIKTGDVVFEGQEGVKVRSYNLGPFPVLEFDIVGVPRKRPEDCDEDLDPFIEELVVVRESGSVFLITQFSDKILAITTDGITQDEICAAQKQRALSPVYDGDGPCDDEVPPGISAPNTDTQIAVIRGPAPQLVTAKMAGGNPIAVAPGPVVPPVVPRIRVAQGADLEDIQRQVDDVMSTPHEGQSIVIGFKGLGAYNV